MNAPFSLCRQASKCAFAIFFGASVGATALATPVTVHLTGGFINQSFTINYANGDYDAITVSATVDLMFTPSQPTCNTTNFASSTAQATGTIHVWGTAVQYDPNPSLTINFDDTWNYSRPGASVPIKYEAQSGLGNIQDLDWEITASVDQERATPYALHYYGGAHLLRLWVALPYPFWYDVNDEYYDSRCSAIVSGQEGVTSCLNGVVTDAATKRSIAGAQVRFGNVPQATDSSGSFYYGSIPVNTYQLIVTNSGYYPRTNILSIPAFTIVQTNVALTPTVPVILVHGWRPAPGVWDSLIAALDANHIVHREVDYRPATGNPQVYAQTVANAVAGFREAGYTGKVDIVCHSMGALVSRWYMEYQHGGDNVRQWIGIAPVNQGAALADMPGQFPLGLFAWVAAVSVEDLRHDGAITEMRTDSATVTALNRSGRWPGVIYRVLAGYNSCAHLSSCPHPARDFDHSFLTRGKTYARITDERGIVHPHASTYFGDGVVALVQSQLPGAISTDCFADLGHTSLPGDPAVIAQVIKYLKDLGAQGLNNCPDTTDLLRDADVQTIGAGNQGILHAGEQRIHNFTADESVQALTASLTYSGSKLAMTLFTPSGMEVVPGVYPVLDFSNANNSVWYVLDAPASGTWSARIDAVDVPATGEPYSFQVFFSSPQELLVGAETGGLPVYPGQSLRLWGNFHDGPTPIIGASVSGEITKPNGQTNHLNFYDDGTHGDSTPGNGVYSANLVPDIAGLYRLSVSAEAGLVQRVTTLNVAVEPVPIRPSLAVHFSGSKVQLSWTSGIGAFLLEGTTNLSATDWFAENAVPEIGSNNLQRVTVNVNGQRYFRLRGPR